MKTKEKMIEKVKDLICEVKIKMAEKVKEKYPTIKDIESPETLGYGSAWYPKLLYDDGAPVLSLIADGEVQGGAELKEDGSFVARETIEGGIFGDEGTRLDFEFVKKRIENICLSDENIDACYYNLFGSAFGDFIGNIIGNNN